MMQQPRNSPP